MSGHGDWKERALEDFREWLDDLPGPAEDGGEDEDAEGGVGEPHAIDLRDLFAEFAALRQEVRLQNREQSRAGPGAREGGGELRHRVPSDSAPRRRSGLVREAGSSPRPKTVVCGPCWRCTMPWSGAGMRRWRCASGGGCFRRPGARRRRSRTFDVSVVAIEDGVVEVLASTGDNRLGGDDFDAVIAERLNAHIETELGIEDARESRLLQARFGRAAEEAKIELSTRPWVRVEEDHVATVDGEPKHLSCELSRADFERDIDELLARTMRSVTTAFDDADVRPSQLDRILLVGGSTRIPCIARLLAERLGQEPHGEVDPDLCVALGAAVQAGIEMGEDMESVLVDITPYTFGTSAMGELHGLPYAHQYVPLIRRNTKLPATRTDAFFTVTEDQEAVEINVYQGEDPDALKNVEIGSFRFSGLNRRRDAYDQGLLFTYHLDLDGLLEVHAVERGHRGGRAAVWSRTPWGVPPRRRSPRRRRGSTGCGARRTPEGEPDRAAGTQGDAADTREESAGGMEAPAEIRDTLERAARALDTAPAEDQEEMIDLIEDLHNALREGRAEDAAAIGQNLDEILFYLE